VVRTWPTRTISGSARAESRNAPCIWRNAPIERGIEAVILKVRAMRALTSIGLCLDQLANPVRVYRVPDRVQVMDLEDRLREMLLLRSADYQLGRRKPAVTILPTDLDFIDSSGERSPQHLGQSRDREKDRERVSVDEHQTRIRVNRPDRGERKHVIGTFEDPALAAGRLMLEVLQKTFVKLVGIQVSSFVEPAAIAGNAIRRAESQAGEDMRRDIRAFLRERALIGAKQAELPRDPPRPEIRAGAGIIGGVGMDHLPDARDKIGTVLRQQAVQEGRARGGSPEMKIGRATD
jgi:hypothetical protein